MNKTVAPPLALRTSWLVPLLLALIILIWGSSWAFIRVGLESFPPFLFAGARFVAAGMILLLVARAQRLALPDARTGGETVLLGMLSLALSIATGYWSQQHIDSGLAAVLFSTMPLFTAVGAWLWLPEERLTWIKIVGLGLGVVGTALLMSDNLTFGGGKPVALGLMILSAASAGLGTAWVKRLVDKVHPLLLTGVQMMVAGPLLLLIGLATERLPASASAGALLSLAYLIVAASCVTFVVYYWVMQRASAVSMSLIAFATPPVAVILGVVFLGERVGLSLLAGMIAIIVGVILVEATG